MKNKAFFLYFSHWFLLFVFIFFAYGAPQKNNEPDNTKDKGRAAVQRIVFEEQKIEGKIRRPQLVLIKADQRPNFSPMIMQSLGTSENITNIIDPTLLEDTKNNKAFKFKNNKIINFKP